MTMLPSGSLLGPRPSVPGLPAADVPYHVRRDRLGDGAGSSGLVPSTVPRGPREHRFSPYQDNGGTVVAVAGKDYCIVAGTTRLGLGYSIPARNVSRILPLPNNVVLGTCGMQADAATLHNVIKARMTMYEHQHQHLMKLGAVSQMLSNTLYYKRFFPYYTSNVLGGLDENGEGWAYGYDFIGSHEKVKVMCTGTAQGIIQPVLDNQVDFKQQHGAQKVDLSLGEAVELVKDAFSSAGERDIYTGDWVEIFTITKAGVRKEEFELKFD